MAQQREAQLIYHSPRHIKPMCPSCGARLVLWDLLDNPNASVVYDDEYTCPDCRDRVYPDRGDLGSIIRSADEAYKQLMGYGTPEQDQG